ncbi:aminopeptidase P family protein [Arthrobacter sp. NPDC090010]|uniref:aminopeptidase P family protein n=1 Tax=Arthrobacter sp. NPDC090010 TaxID=3363942 RepID=UPI0037FEB58B
MSTVRPPSPRSMPSPAPNGSHSGSAGLALAGPSVPRPADAEGFRSFIATGWGSPERPVRTAPGTGVAAMLHRERLSEHFPGRPLLISAGSAPLRSGDCFYEFRPDSAFVWLTGCQTENAVLVMSPSGTGHDSVLYIPEPFGPGDRGFFEDTEHGELWAGPVPGLAEWEAALQITVRPLSRLGEAVDAVVPALRAGHHEAPAALRGMERSAELDRVLAELRLVKDAWEIGQLREAVNATVEGFAQVIREVPRSLTAGGERWLQGTFDRAARTLGNGPGYATIVGCGGHAPTLHWSKADGAVTADELLLLDMGVELRSLYTADVTRTFPVSGTFSPEQRRVYELVEKAHRAALAAVGPGKRFSDFYTASLEVIAQGLHDWDLLPVSVDEALSPGGQQHRRWIVCGVGHHLGLDVHDCAGASYAAYQAGTLEPGNVLAVEPGLYFHSHDLTVPDELRGIGIRIEDNVLVTGAGHEVLSDALPSTADGIERWMAAVLG